MLGRQLEDALAVRDESRVLDNDIRLDLVAVLLQLHTPGCGLLAHTFEGGLERLPLGLWG